MRQWLVNKLPLLDADGEIENIVTVALDIGERKRGELEMRKAKDAAEAALRNLRETQNSLIEAEKLAALGRLVAGVAHEVNNPVGISLTVASSLERKTAMFSAEVARGDLKRSSLTEFLETSRDAASQLVANLNRAAELITSFKQVAADRNYSDKRTFDLADLTEQVVLSLRPGLRKHNLTLTVDCQPDLIMNSYPGPYGQVLTNLFLNAVAHAFPEGRSGAIDIRARASGKDNVEIIFSDNGCGMSLDVRRRAFDPFFTTRRDQGRHRSGPAYRLQHRDQPALGSTRSDLEPDGGTRIQIVLPRAAPMELAAEWERQRCCVLASGVRDDGGRPSNLAHLMHVVLRTRRGCWSKIDMNNWIEAGGHAPQVLMSNQTAERTTLIGREIAERGHANRRCGFAAGDGIQVRHRRRGSRARGT